MKQLPIIIFLLAGISFFVGSCASVHEQSDHYWERTMVKSFSNRKIIHHDKFVRISPTDYNSYILYFNAGDEISVNIHADGEHLKIDKSVNLKVVKKIYLLPPRGILGECEKSAYQNFKTKKENIDRLRHCSSFISDDMNTWHLIFSKSALKLTLGRGFNFSHEFSSHKGLVLKAKFRKKKKKSADAN